MAENQVYLIKSGQNSFVEETEAIIGISGGKVGIGTTAPEADLHVTGSVKIGGDLAVDGTFTTINSNTISVDDKNIELGSTDSPTDLTADGGGITVKGSSDKTFNWSGDNSAWTSSEHLYLANGKHFSADELRALDSDGLKLVDQTTSGVLIKGGKVGIHKAAPVYDLDVDGSGNFASLYVGGNAVLTTADGDLGKWDGETDIYYTAGKVGVSNDSPDYNLHVSGDAAVDGNFIVNGTSGNLNVESLNVSGEYINIGYVNDGLNSDRGGIKVIDPDGTGKFEYVASSDLWQLDQKLEIAGDLDIGGSASIDNNLTIGGNLTVAGSTTTINTQEVLIEDHNLVIASNTGYHQITGEWPTPGDGYAGLYWGTGDNQPSPISLTYQHNKGFAFEGGNVGIGTTNPTSPNGYSKTLLVSDSNSASIILSRTSATASSIEIGTFSNSNLIDSIGLGVPLRFKVDGQERMRIDSDGNVGIGTTSPDTKLHIRGNGSTETKLTIDSTTTSHVASIGFVADSERAKILGGYQSGGGGFIKFNTDTTGGTSVDRMIIDNQGDVGIGTTNPAAKLDVNGEILQSGNTVVDQGDIGSAPNQIPLNKDLGSLAYMNAPEIEDLNVDTLELREIAAEMSDTAVDVFVYDTRKDSDGGAWRSRTKHTSWYNEELNTATRGGRREFPAVAVIVAEASKVTIYDGDDPDLNMWMVFNKGGNWSTTANLIGDATIVSNVTALFAINGIFALGNRGAGILVINFIDETHPSFWGTNYSLGVGTIAERNDGLGWPNLTDTTKHIVNNAVNDVAMTVLPNAPIDSDTGLPIPTIAVATDGGVSVIKDDGSVVDITCSQAFLVYSYYVVFDQLNRLFFSLDGQGNKRRIWGLNNIPTTDLIVTTDINEKQNGDIFIADNNGFGTATKDMFLFNQSHPQVEGFASDNSIGTSQGLFKAFINKENSSKSLYNYTTSSYNTGWMPGDIKLATLSDTKIETVGVDESDELIGNATYGSSARLTSYTYSNGDATVTIDNDESSHDGYVQLSLNGLIAGKKYKIEMQGSVSYTPSATVYNNKIANADGNVIELDSSKQGTTDLNSLEFTASNENYLYLYGGDLTYTLSLKQTGELITNGTFDDDTNDWTKGAGWSVSGGVGVASSISSTSLNSNIFTTVVGKTYTVSFDLVSRTAGTVLLYAYDTSNIANSGAQSAVGTYSFTFIARQTSTQLYFFSTTSFSGTVDNVSVRLAEEDRSVNDNGLQIFGEITKSPVAPGADLVAYSGFSANNYLMQPYNSDLDFGTGDFYMSIWAYGGGAYQALMIREHSSVDDGGSILLFQYNNIYSFQCRQDGTADWTYSNSLTEYGSRWNHIMMVRTGGILYGYVNGKLETSFDFSGDISNNDASFYIGRRSPKSSGGSIQYFTGSLALAKIGATAPTPEQIAKIYRDEKPLFQDGAQATLYGTSDAVTALAYDDKTELLHVGTSGGRSDFAGLRRINNTTTAVTTSISASNNLIAEQ